MAKSAPLMLLLAGAHLVGASRIMMQSEKAALQRQGSASESEAAAATGASANATWEKLSQRFCVAADAELACDDNSIMAVYSAFYGRSSLGGECKPPEPKGAEPCTKNATDAVLAKCQGSRRCTLPSSFHSAACRSQHSMRVVYECVNGDPQGAGAEEQELASHPLKHDDTDVEEKAKQQVSLPNLEVDFNPCYRKTRWQLLQEGTPFRRLTTCPDREGCFKLEWEDNRVFSDVDTPPSRARILQASLAEGDDLHLTWKGIGLKRNEYNTWGVCLPKTEGVNFAVAVFNSLRSVLTALGA